MSSRQHHTVEAQLEAASLACVQRGARLTELRRRVLALILEAEAPSTAYQLLDRLKQTHKGAVPPTVYRALDFLLEQRLIHRLERMNAFIACSHADHPHDAVQFLICRRCGTVAEIEDRAVSRALEHAAEREGFHAGPAMVELEGTCAACMHE